MQNAAVFRVKTGSLRKVFKADLQLGPGLFLLNPELLLCHVDFFLITNRWRTFHAAIDSLCEFATRYLYAASDVVPRTGLVQSI